MEERPGQGPRRQNKNGGRGNTGRITSRRKGGGHKTAYRLVDFRRAKFDVAATVERIEYDPNRTGFIALIKYADGELSYILAPQRLAVGDQVVSGQTADVKPGNAMPLGAMPVGTIVITWKPSPARVVHWRVLPVPLWSPAAIELRLLKQVRRNPHG
jgi:large subunit ribosomal protein L2